MRRSPERGGFALFPVLVLAAACSHTPVADLPPACDNEELGGRECSVTRENDAESGVPRRLSREEAIELAREHDPRTRILRARLGVEEERARIAGRPADPEIRAGVDRTWRNSGDRSRYDGYDVGLRVFPAMPGQKRSLRDEAEARLDAADHLLRAAEQSAMRDVIAIYTRLQEIDVELDIRRRRSGIASERLQVVKERAEYGSATRMELVQARAASMNAARDIAELKREEARLLRELAAATGLCSVAGIDPLPVTTGDILLSPMDGSFRRHEVDAAARQLDEADAVWRRERAALRPWFSHLQAAYGEDDRTGRNQQWSLQAAVEIPIFSLAYRRDREAFAERELARVRYEEASAGFDRLLDGALAEWHDAQHAYRDLSQTHAPVLEEMRKTLEEARAEPDVERMTLLRLEETLLEAELALLRSRFDLQRARDSLQEFVR